MFTWSLAVRNLKRRKLRTALTASGIVVGISMMFILLSLVSGMEVQARRMVRALGGADMIVSNSTSFRGGMGGGFFGTLPSLSTLDISIVDVIGGMPGVYAVSPQFSFSGSINGRRVTIYGIVPPLYDLVTGGLNIVEGRSLMENSSGEIVFGKALIKALPRLGDKTQRKGLSGHPPDLRNPPPGCRFGPRCPFSGQQCKEESPTLREVKPGRFVECWLYYT
ncbi:MAG: ABC transporter permease [Candidatus Bathyarchaeia archaeon]